MEQKTVLYLTYDGLTDDLGQSQVLPYIIGLCEKGFKFHIISFEKKQKYEHKKEVIANLIAPYNIVWHPQMFSQKFSVLSKIWDLTNFKRTAKSIVNKFKIDIVHSRSYISATVGNMLKKQFGTAHIFDIRGFWIEERIDNGQWKQDALSGRYRINYFKKRELELYKNADKVISLTHKAKDIIIEKFSIESKKIEVIPCCADLNLFDSKNVSAKQQLEILNKYQLSKQNNILVYSGSIFGWYLTEEIFKFFKLFLNQSENNKIILLSNESKEEITKQAIAKSINLNNFALSHATRAEMPIYLSIARLSVFFIKPSYSKQASSPTKMAEFLAMGIPVVTNTNVGDSEYIINKYNCGVLVKDFEQQTLVNGLNAVLQMQVPYANAKQAAIDYFSLSKGIELYNQVYISI